MDYGDDRLPQRYWDKVYPCPITGCWLWGGAEHDGYPYGIWRVGNKTCRAHVSSFMATGGRVSTDKPFVLHACDQPSCVNPEHLRAGTQTENMADLLKRNRGNLGRRTRLTSANVQEIRRRSRAGESNTSIAASFGVSRPSISMIVNNRRWASPTAKKELI